MDTTLFIGIAGMALILIAFIMNQAHKWTTDTRAYDLLNALGGLLLTLYAYLLWSIPFLVLNAVWTIFSIKDLFQAPQKKKHPMGHRRKKK